MVKLVLREFLWNEVFENRFWPIAPASGEVEVLADQWMIDRLIIESPLMRHQIPDFTRTLEEP